MEEKNTKWNEWGARMGRNELTMSRFYTEPSDYTNGGNGQKIFCMAYGTSAAICASFHKNWHWHLWWSVVTAKNTASPEQGVGGKREGEERREEKRREGGLMSVFDWQLMWCSNPNFCRFLFQTTDLIAPFLGHEFRLFSRTNRCFLKHGWWLSQSGPASPSLLVWSSNRSLTLRRAPTLWPGFVLLTFSDVESFRLFVAYSSGVGTSWHLLNQLFWVGVQKGRSSCLHANGVQLQNTICIPSKMFSCLLL